MGGLEIPGESGKVHAKVLLNPKREVVPKKGPFKAEGSLSRE